MLADSESIRVETFRLNEHGPLGTEEYNSLIDTIIIKAINESISLSEIYDGVRIRS